MFAHTLHTYRGTKGMKAVTGFSPGNCFGLPAARRAAVPLRLRASMRGAAVGVGVGGKGVPLALFCAEEEVGF